MAIVCIVSHLIISNKVASNRLVVFFVTGKALYYVDLRHTKINFSQEPCPLKSSKHLQPYKMQQKLHLRYVDFLFSSRQFY